MNGSLGGERSTVELSVVGVQTAEAEDEMTRRVCGADEGESTYAKTILLVEDELFVREVTCEVLRSAGYRVLAAKDSVEAVRIYETHSCEVDLLLTDVILPGETGRVLAARLRHRDPKLKVLLVTGYPEHMGMQDRKSEECLTKPFSTEVLLKKVRQLFDCGETAGAEVLKHACGIA